MSGRRALERSPERPLEKRAAVKPLKRAKAPRAPKAVKPPKRRTRSSIGSRLLSLGAMLFAGALAVGMSLPATGCGPGDDILSAIAQPSVLLDQGERQTVEVGSTATAPSAARDTYTALSW